MASQPFTASSFEKEDPFISYGRSLLPKANNKGVPVSIIRPIDKDTPPVGILGGGMAGLYTALILSSLKIPFQILEGANRVGGRCYTHKFEESGEYDYYDVGAMRFPLPKDCPKDCGEGPHKRLKDLFELLHIPLLEYHYKNPQGIMYFNGLHASIGEKKFNFNAESLGVAEPYRAAGAEELCEDFLKEPLKVLMENHAGWDKFKQEFDKYSTRSYLQFRYRPSKKLRDDYGIPDDSLPICVIDWLEIFDNSSGSFDRALTESVLEAIAFGAVPGMSPEWRCIDHGTSVLPETCLKKVREWAKEVPNMPKQVIIKGARVTAMSASDPNDIRSPLIVTAGGKEYTYSHVISTVPLPNFSFIDTSSLNISVMQRNAIRRLQYGSSTKVGILFKTAWWKDCNQVPGGQSFTDLPIRTVVYPSYGADQSSRVLIASYCWTNDAERLGNLIDNKVDCILLDVMLRNLATVHKLDVKFLKDQYIDHHAWNWNHDACTGGGSAYFGPSQYEYLYDALNAPAADGRLQWAGDLLSVRHAWIVGALDSAWAACLRYLFLIGAQPKKFDEFYKKWGTNLEWHDGKRSSPKGPASNQRQRRSSEKELALAIPPEHNLLLRHIILHNPEQQTILAAPTWT
ncbi:hypothetical protein BKA70DRAFT_825472 [Coprinopsis sp. MPI-PUGE-AT-0042]|nr:hypothetical protein BKA70DRAFT_825472 [Coprinopsis sp. MPI-PUGE-AT-0042]